MVRNTRRNRAADNVYYLILIIKSERFKNVKRTEQMKKEFLKKKEEYNNFFIKINTENV